MSKKIDELKKQFDNIEIPENIDLYIEKGISKGKKVKRKKYTSLIIPAACAASFALVLALNNPFADSLKKPDIVAANDKNLENNINLEAAELPVVGSFANLKSLLKSSMNIHLSYGMDAEKSMGLPDTNSMAESSTDEALILGNANTSSKEKDYSGTNNQVEEVDEGDIVKTDGEYIYKITYNKLFVVKAYPSQEMKITDSILFKEDGMNLNPRDLILMDNKLVVIASSYTNQPLIEYDLDSDKEIAPYFPQELTTIYVYDTTDKYDLKLLKKVQVSGNYTTTRRIDSMLYITSNKYVNHQIFDKKAKVSEHMKNDLPFFIDSAANNKKIEINYNHIKYCPDTITPNYLIVASIDLKNIEKQAKVTSILGNGYTVYTSEKNMYIAGHTKYDKKTQTTNTVIYKFSLNNGDVKFDKKGEIPGTLLNQFSLDEYNNNLRVATTTNRNPFNSISVEGNLVEQKTDNTNNVYILDSNMKIKGKIENIAPEERIYSVRYMGPRAYMVTFKNTDPLFVIDLNNPTAPKILGELKIPGFSSYLHPYDENHLIGVGQDADVIVEKGPNGEKVERAKVKGLKLSIYDVSNVKKPVEKFKTIIGDTGTYSDLLYNHKAMLFSKEKGIFALPVTINNYELLYGSENSKSSDSNFQGAYVYDIDLNNGFSLQGKISHNDKTKAEKNIVYGDKFINRILYIKDSIYTVSQGAIKANLMDNLKEQNFIELK